MKRRIWCKKHKHWHSSHKSQHCKLDFCPRALRGKRCLYAPVLTPGIVHGAVTSVMTAKTVGS